MKAPRLQLEITARAGRGMVPYLKRLIPKAVELAGSPLCELSVVLLGDRAIGELHDRFFGDPETTDVITFPLELDGRGRALSGELYVCVPMARRQAKIRRIAPEQELLLYCVHGILHLNGHDDRTGPEYKRMHKKEDEILTRLGVGSTFAVQPQEPAAKPAKRKERT